MKAALVLVLALTGCATLDAPEETPTRGAGSCDATGTDRFVGMAATSDLGADIMAMTRADRMRWINRDTLVTADYREDRINVKLDDAGRVTELRCY